MSTSSSPSTPCPGLPPEGQGTRGRAQPDEALELEAATWAVRRHGGLDARGRAALQAWLAADPRHAPALEAMSATLQGVQQMPCGDAARLRAGLPARSARPWPRTSWLRPFAARAAVAAMVLLLAGAGWFGWWLQPTFQQSYAAQRGQQLIVTLPDDASSGSTVQLDSATHIHARLFRDRREVRLGEGQAMFAVHSDRDRPFHVLAGDWRITVVGTRFSVRHTATGLEAGRIVVAVEQGRVQVQRTQEPAQASSGKPPVVVLDAGQMLAAGSTDPGTVSRIAPAAVAQWRSGRISFNQTPLGQALAEFERYGPTGLVVRDPAVAALPVGGSYGLRQHQRFAQFLPQLLPVRLVQHDGITEIVAR